jgi:hypothetical protein
MSLGQPIAGLVRRSLCFRVEQLQRQIDLGESLLRHGMVRPEALAQICTFLDRAFHACAEELRDLPVTEAEKAQLSARLDDMKASIAAARRKH